MDLFSSVAAWRFSSGGGGQQQNGAPSNQTSSLTRLAALAIFPTFVMVLFDTLTWSRAECRHLIDLGERGGLGAAPRKIFRDHALQTLGKQGPCPFRRFLVQEDLPSNVLYFMY